MPAEDEVTGVQGRPNAPRWEQEWFAVQGLLSWATGCRVYGLPGFQTFYGRSNA